MLFKKSKLKKEQKGKAAAYKGLLNGTGVLGKEKESKRGSSLLAS